MNVLYPLAGYLLGSIPVAWLVTKIVTGEDLRGLGSGNVGVTNVALQATRWAGLLVFIAEVSKGVIAVLVPRSLGADELWVYGTVLAAVIGTRWPIWLRFSGGRGNSTGIGAILVLSWHTLALGLPAWLLARLVTGSSFYATRISFVVWPVVFGLLQGSWGAFFFGAILAAVYASTHRRGTDDHLLIKARWSSLIGFLTSPRRR